MVELPESLKIALATHPYHKAVVRAEKAVDLGASHAQREALNARVGHVKLHGFLISVEWPKGSTRKGIGKDGKEWSRLMKFSYGRLLRTRARDGDHFDVYIGDDPESELVFIIDQLKEDGSLDEQKAMIGFTNLAAARAAYLAHFPKGWEESRVGKIIPMTIPFFKKWLAKNVGWKKSAALLPGVSLQPHQTSLAEESSEQPVRKLLMHGLGSGKTVSGLAMAESRGEPYTVIAPASLRAMWNKERDRFTDRKIPSTVMSYTEAAKGKPTANLGSLILDEAQSLRNPGSKRTMAVSDLAAKAHQLMLLSGTPAVNRPGELAPLTSMLTGSNITPKEFEDRYVGEKKTSRGLLGWLAGVTPGVEPDIQHRKELEALLEGHVDYYHPDKPAVPTQYEDVHAEMSPLQTRIYKAMMGKLPWHLRYKLKHDIGLTKDELRRAIAFLNGPRQVGLSPLPFLKNQDPYRAFKESPKLQKALESALEVLKNPRAKVISHSNFISAGLHPYSAALTKENIPHAIFHGGLSDEERKRLVEDFNTGKTRMALVGPSGSEGISLRGAQLSQLLDSHWHGARGRQQIGRGLRFDSHTGLPEDLQHMRVQRFTSRLPLGFKDRMMEHLGFDRTGSRRAADDYLQSLSARKDKELGVFMDLLKDVGSHKHADVYHGSSTPGLTQIEPMPSNALSGRKAVFGTTDRAHAISFIPKWTDSDIEHGRYNDEPWYIKERKPGAIQRIFHGASGSLYTLPHESFGPDAAVSQSELVSNKATPVLKEEKIRDVLQVLREAGWRFKYKRAVDMQPTDKPLGVFMDLLKDVGSHKHAVAVPPTDKPLSLMKQLALAKEFSDHSQYDAKLAVLLPLMQRKPQDWIIDSDDPKLPVVGVTHRTGWRYHLPRQAVAGLNLSRPGVQPVT